jgi:hypothetical protein
MLSEDTKKIIDSMTEDELQEEINRGRRSRFQREKYAYLQTRLAFLRQQEQEKQRQENIKYKQEELSLARQGNKHSKIANLVYIFIALIALGTLIYTVWSSWKVTTPTQNSATMHN